MQQKIQAETEEDGLHAPKYKWPQSSFFNSYDHKSIRRGYQVYKEVCSSCHSMHFIAFRSLVGVSHTEKQVKALAEEYEYDDEPNEEGEVLKRPGKV